MDPVIALDIGGTKLAAAIVSSEGVISARVRCDTPSAADPEVVFGALRALADEVSSESSTPLHSCGVGCGGPMAPGGARVSPLNIPAWRDFPLADRLSSHLGLAVAIDNDAKALALAEGWRGAASESSDFMAMVVSTGVGGGIVLDGRLLDGSRGNAGHVGHVVVEPNGRPCACGGTGCLEAHASGPSIAAVTGVDPERAPLEVRHQCGRHVGRAVASVVNLLDLDLVVVAGSVTLGFGVDFFDAANEELRHRTGLDFTREARIVPAGLGADGPLIGAGAVALRAAGVTLGAVRPRIDSPA